MAIQPLEPHQLTHRLDPDSLGFACTSELSGFTGVMGQQRALSAMEFGVAMQRFGYNLYVTGEPGTGRFRLATEYLERQAETQPTPSDWAYVNNFKESREPRIIELPAGKGAEFQKSIEQLVDNLLATFPAVFEHPTYQQRKTAIDLDFSQRYDRAIDEVERSAAKRGIAVFRENGNISFTPMVEGKALDEAAFAQLSEKDRDLFHEQVDILESELNDALVGLPQWKRESVEKLRLLNRETIERAIAPLLEPLEELYKDFSGVHQYIGEIRENLYKTVLEQLVDERLLDTKEEAGKRAWLIEEYLPNLIVTHEESGGAPVVFEPHPSYKNLFGHIDYRSDQGMLNTNYRLIFPGSLQQANGGYLIVDAEKLLEEPFVWPALKRALKSNQLKIENPASELGLATITLAPEILPLNVKVVMIGPREVYYLLAELDPDFNDLFRVLVDFDGHVPRTQESVALFAQTVRARTEREGYSHLSAEACARLVEYSSRLAEHQRRLSARLDAVMEVVAEADFLCRGRKVERIERDQIEEAVYHREQRSGRLREQLLDDLLDGIVLMDVAGHAVGRVNGLTVLQIGDSSFGNPARISATVFPGYKGVVDIEREVNLGQAIHSKGVMILSGYLGNRFARDFPLAISANLAMEQSYGYIDGDSASAAELCALISALTRIPLRQDLSITGSLNQHGEIQAIGGVNEKIEGFFALCKARGLSGSQGVIIPRANVINLMLRDEVLEAVSSGRFAIYAVGHVDEALELLTEREAGRENERGLFEPGTVNGAVVKRLKAFSDISRTQGGDE